MIAVLDVVPQILAVISTIDDHETIIAYPSLPLPNLALKTCTQDCGQKEMEFIYVCTDYIANKVRPMIFSHCLCILGCPGCVHA